MNPVVATVAAVAVGALIAIGTTVFYALRSRHSHSNTRIPIRRDLDGSTSIRDLNKDVMCEICLDTIRRETRRTPCCRKVVHIECWDFLKKWNENCPLC